MEPRLTGRTRWRNKRVWFGIKPVIQVEYEAMICENLGLGHIECDTRAFWRDVTPADYLNCPAIARQCVSAQQTDI
jgi:hypothetical protein